MSVFRPLNMIFEKVRFSRRRYSWWRFKILKNPIKKYKNAKFSTCKNMIFQPSFQKNQDCWLCCPGSKSCFLSFCSAREDFDQLERIFNRLSTDPLFDGRWDFRFFQSKTRFWHSLTFRSQVPSGHKLYLSTHFWHPQAKYHIFTPVFIVFRTFFNDLDKLLKTFHDLLGQK